MRSQCVAHTNLQKFSKISKFSFIGPIRTRQAIPTLIVKPKITQDWTRSDFKLGHYDCIKIKEVFLFLKLIYKPYIRIEVVSAENNLFWSVVFIGSLPYFS